MVMTYQDFVAQQAGGGRFPRLRNVVNNLGGPDDPNLTPQENAARAAQARMAMAAQLLAASGPAPRGTRGSLQPFGEALMAGQAAGMNATEQALRARVIQAQMAQAQSPERLIGVANPSDFTPESLGEYQQTGDPRKLVPRNNMFGKYTPSNYTTESWAKFSESGDPAVLVLRPQYRAQETPGGGSIAVNTTDPTQNVVIRTPEAGTREASDRARATATATAEGEAFGKAQGAILARATNAQGIQEILDIAEPLIDEATGSGSGAIRDSLAAFFGMSTEGAQATAQLMPLQAGLMMSMPRMEGPQSDRDVMLYQKAAGDIGNPEIPRETKKAAIRTIRELHQKYASRAPGGAGNAAGTAPRRVRVDAQGNVIGN